MLSYLDPASGSAILSAAVAGAAGVAVAAKSMAGRFRRPRRAGEVPVEDDSQTQAVEVDQDEH
jgi:streptogramin lyase